MLVVEADEGSIDRVIELTRSLESMSPGLDRERLLERRGRLLDALGMQCHVRRDPTGDVVVLYPASWVVDGSVEVDRIDNIDEAIERPLDDQISEEDWSAIYEHNMAIAETVERRCGPVHGETVRALATYLANHHLRRMEEATPSQLETFKEDYFERNAWPSKEQVVLVERSIEMLKRIL